MFKGDFFSDMSLFFYFLTLKNIQDKKYRFIMGKSDIFDLFGSFSEHLAHTLISSTNSKSLKMTSRQRGCFKKKEKKKKMSCDILLVD